MKNNESKRIISSLVLMLALSLGAFGAAFRFAGQTDFVGACVSLLIPTFSARETAEKIGIAAKRAITGVGIAKKDENDSESPAKISSLAYLPEDINSVMNIAEKTFSQEEKGGKIEEVTYGKASATQSAGDILVKNTTGRSLDIASVLQEKTALEKAEEGDISVLIFHTHTSECYQILDRSTYLKSFSPRTDDKSLNMVRVGEEIAQQLKNAGIGVIHDTEIYDTKYSGAYERSGEAIDKYLEKYPTIQVVIDVHRDAIQTSSSTKVKPVTTIGGKKAAQIMIITGCEGGDVTDFPDWEYNLRFALQLQKTAEEMYPTLMRPLFFCNRRYNMYKSKCSVLLEMGSDGNTLDEAAYSGRLIGDALATMLEKEL